MLSFINVHTCLALADTVVWSCRKMKLLEDELSINFVEFSRPPFRKAKTEVSD